jgi:hypothetical protein
MAISCDTAMRRLTRSADSDSLVKVGGTFSRAALSGGLSGGPFAAAAVDKSNIRHIGVGVKPFADNFLFYFLFYFFRASRGYRLLYIICDCTLCELG